ncbi:hypothetical protein [Streptacidiphilus albus]|uniref:hypothetical protein n=1 Tax=Streptacidiphilus albus TaxID=105425 RepID=UPI00054B6DC8|nr:hypothetical protein [Streptacidiphilus albus]
MTPGPLPLAAATVFVALLITAASAYFARVELPRPPIGTYQRSDIVVMSVILIVAPLGYLSLPRDVVATIFGVVMLSAVQLTLAPFIGGRAALASGVVLCGATAAAWLLHRPGLTAGLSDAVLTIAVVGVANLWAQGGIRAGQLAAFAFLLTGYDLVATGLTTVMTRFATEVQGLPFAPVLVIAQGRAPVSIGLGDLLMLLLFPLTAAKAFGRLAGQVAAVAGIAVTAVVALLFWLNVLGTTVPLLTVLGPVIVGQYLLWRRLGRRERSVLEWRSGAPVVTAPVDRLAVLEAAGRVVLDMGVTEGTWVAIDRDRVVGTGPSPGLAHRSARRNGHGAVPVVRQA